ncbi:hypothetical protein CHU92_08660 [Flavobacterium cyanobacteriorum]|uniref:DUF3857 domain-containing protein n=1 Tax=Flavobacterium cyanobacteriorum TaxID=2022802 RepID=A0A255Z979_9FLAO|nr:DUF3857 domain-containing protein [Flavobacterium cyanobacteriorum]OYQ37200.1 hypothetical protein CHU92_08660 [Flavobacterium cyanobacteriorum]
MKESLKIKIVILLLVLMSSANTHAQDFSFKDYNWDEKNVKAEIPAKYKDEKEVILERRKKIELVAKGGNATQYYLFHDKKYINSDEAVERNNRIYISYGSTENLLTTKARVILRDGKIIELKKSDIKEEVDEERGLKFKYFAVNGLEKGAVIETIFIREESPELKGQTVDMQSEYPIVKNTFQLIYPDHLKFKTKSYNGLSEPVKEEKTPTEGKATLTLTENDVPALNDDEKYSNWNSQVKRLRYKLDENYANNARNLYNFKEFSTNFYDRFHPEYNKKDQKAIDDFCKDIPKSANLREQVWNIENKIKKTIMYSKYTDSKETLQDIIKAKQANQTDILKLYIAVFRTMKVDYNMVLTSDRYKVAFDRDFESYENLRELLFYFPAINMFMTPTEAEYRIPLFPNELAGTNGLFIKEKNFAGTRTGIGEVKMIDIPGADITHDVMDITIDFTKDIENPVITDRLQFGGYSAMNFQPVKDFAQPAQYKDFLKNVAENYTVETEFKELKTENEGVEFIGKKPFVLNVIFEGKGLVRKAGDNYLFSVGQTIGRQMELYQENKRVLPVEINYPHLYTRKIKIILPEGATIKNLEKFTMNNTADVNGKTEAAFISKYEKKGNVILVENTEYYNILHYPLENFEAYRAVINAAADFNKIVVVMSK